MMYSNNILNFQKSTPILNACTKKAVNLLKAPPMSMLGRSQKSLVEEFVFTSPDVLSMSCMSYMDVCEMGSLWPFSSCFVASRI